MNRIDDPLAYFEVMDRAAMIGNIIQDNLGKHPLMDADPELKKEYENLEMAIGKFYQTAGRCYFRMTVFDK